MGASREPAARVEVRWIGGGVDLFDDVAPDQLLTLTEGTGRAGGR